MPLTCTSGKQLSVKQLIDYVANHLRGATGPDGKSAYEVYKILHPSASELDFFNSIAGPKGDAGHNGLDAYRTWEALPVNHGKTFTEWMASLKGARGLDGHEGKSAYDIWKDHNPHIPNAFTDYVKAITGPQGPAGMQGANGTGVTIAGTVNYSDLLPKPTDAVPPKDGDSYFVTYAGLSSAAGTVPKGDLLMYNGHDKTWHDMGHIQGPQGPQGKVGPIGPAGATGVNGTNGTALHVVNTQTALDVIPKTADHIVTVGTAFAPFAKGDMLSYNPTSKAWETVSNINGVDGASGKGIYPIAAQSELLAVPNPTKNTVLITTAFDKYKVGDLLKQNPNNQKWVVVANIVGAKGAKGDTGLDAYHEWLEFVDPTSGHKLNQGKTLAQFVASNKGAKGDKGDRGLEGKNAFETWKAIPANAGKTITDYLAVLTGKDGSGYTDASIHTTTGDLWITPMLPTGSKGTPINLGHVVGTDGKGYQVAHVKNDGYLYLTDMSGTEHKIGPEKVVGPKGAQGVQGIGFLHASIDDKTGLLMITPTDHNGNATTPYSAGFAKGADGSWLTDMQGTVDKITDWAPTYPGQP